MELDQEQESGYEVEYIFGKSLHLDKQKFLAKWVNYPKSQHTAEPFENLELNNTEAIYRYERAHFYHTLQQHVYNRQYDGKMVRIESTSMRVVQCKGEPQPVNFKLLGQNRSDNGAREVQYGPIQVELELKSRADNQSATENLLSTEQSLNHRQSTTGSSVGKRGRPKKAVALKSMESVEDVTIDITKKQPQEEYQEIEAQKLRVVIENQENSKNAADGDISVDLKNCIVSSDIAQKTSKKKTKLPKQKPEVDHKLEHNSYYRTFDNNEDNELEIFRIPYGCSFDFIHRQLQNQALLHLIEQKVDCKSEFGNFLSDTPKKISFHALGVDPNNHEGKLKLFFKVDFQARDDGAQPRSIWITKDQAVKHIKDLFLSYTLQNTIWLPTFSKD